MQKYSKLEAAIEAAIIEGDSIGAGLLQDGIKKALANAKANLAKLLLAAAGNTEAQTEAAVMRATVDKFVKRNADGSKELGGVRYRGDIPPQVYANFYKSLMNTGTPAEAADIKIVPEKVEEKKSPAILASSKESEPVAPADVVSKEQEKEEEEQDEASVALAKIEKAATADKARTLRGIDLEVIEAIAASIGIDKTGKKRADLLAEIWEAIKK